MTNQAASKSTSISTRTSISVSISIKYTRKQSDSNERKKTTYNHKHRDRARRTASQTGRQDDSGKKERETDRKLRKKNTRKKIFSYIFMFNTHLLLFVYITRYVCVFAISHMLIYSLRSTPQIQARAVSVLHTHSPPLSFARFNPNSLLSHLSELYVCTAKTTEKKEYVEHFIISNTFSRHFVRKKSHNNNEFARHIRIHMKNCFLSSECVPIIMHFHCIKSMPIFFSPSPPVPILLAFLPYSTHAHSQFR